MILSYQWMGVEEAMRRLNNLASLGGLDAELEAEGDAIVTEARAYPTELPSQRYRRTYQLRGGWRRSDARRQGHTIALDVSNPVEYAPDVQGDGQFRAFRGRWKRLRTIGDEKRGEVRARAQAWALRTWRGG